tara:strand:+ start:294 stop:1031 length:738 start_codon:yes stop_codon:yes gene_type:complete
MKKLLLKHIIFQLFVLTVAYDLISNFRMLLFSSFMVIVFLASLILYFYKKNKFKNLQKIKYDGLYGYIIIGSILIAIVGDFIPNNYTNPVHNLFTNYKIIGLNDGETIESGYINDNGTIESQYIETFRYHVNVDDFKNNNRIKDPFNEFLISGTLNDKMEGSFVYEYLDKDEYGDGGYSLNAFLFENKQMAFISGYESFYTRNVDVNHFRLPFDYLKNFVLYNVEKILILFLFFYHRGFIVKNEK